MDTVKNSYVLDVFVYCSHGLNVHLPRFWFLPLKVTTLILVFFASTIAAMAQKSHTIN